MIWSTRLLFWADAFTVSPNLVLVRPKYQKDAGLLAHERVHQGQMRADGWLRFVWRYLCSRRWRACYEVEAYRVSIAHGMPLPLAAWHLKTKYWLGITHQQAVDLLYLP